MSDDLVKVTVCEGKYTFGQRKDGSCYALRYGETWREDIFDGLTLAMAHHIEELEKTCDEWAEVSQSNYQRARVAEAKLAKAVEAFTDLEQDCEADYPPSHGAMKYYIQRALAELKGEQP